VCVSHLHFSQFIRFQEPLDSFLRRGCDGGVFGLAQWRSGAGSDGLSMCLSLRPAEGIGEAVNHRQAIVLRARIVHVFWMRRLRLAVLRRRQPIAAGSAALLAHNDLAGQSD
jgi:hypothetical protein